ncbi:MAG: rhodanese-related sulfurtransferase [Candidatus Campbellbacteria bacterium]|nr:rhodanese-related sulfurtransferase [Candidatus Campbellbacteria bacterium]
MYTIILFYKYITIEDPEKERDEQRELCERHGLTGRLIVANEGINGTLEGREPDIKKYIQALTEDERFSDIDFKTSKGTGGAFPKLSVKVRSEIVSSRLGSGVNPQEDTGTKIDPDELHRWYEEGRDFTVIDMRNDYEFVSGHFHNSVDPGMRNFRDLPEKAKELEHLKDKTVVTVCTGGVRCEKASAYLKSQGFSKVHQLKGGLHRYIEKYPAAHFKGGLYVFDGRVVMETAPDQEREVVGKCQFCGVNTEKYADDDSVTPSRQILCCDSCFQDQGNLRRNKESRKQTSA